MRCRRLRGIDGRRVLRTYVRLTVASILAGVVAFALAALSTALLGSSFAGALIALLAGGGIGGALLFTLTARMRISEATALLQAIRTPLVANRATAPLFDTPRYTRHLEAAYATMWEIHRQGGVPRSFAVGHQPE